MSSRPSTSQSHYSNRPSSRASSALSGLTVSSGSTLAGVAPAGVPFTPRASGTRNVARMGLLSARQLDKMESTLASVRKPAKRPVFEGDAIAEVSGELGPDVLGDDGEDDGQQRAATMDAGYERRRTKSSISTGANLGSRAHRGLGSLGGAPVPDGSFLAESSFKAAPLNSRVPPFSPRNANKTSKAKPPSSSSRTRFASPTRGGRTDDQDGMGTESESEGEAEGEESAEYDLEEDLRDKAKSRSKKVGKMVKESLKGVEVGVQEALIVEDLLFVLMGIEGQFITFHPDYAPEDEFERLKGAKFVIDEDLDHSLADMVERILPLATYYTSIDAFVETQSHLEYGLINHALCSAIRDLLREYLVLIAQLEHQFSTSPSFTLQRLWFYVHPTLHTLSLIHGLASEISELQGTLDEDDEDLEEDSDLSDGDKYGGAGLKAVLGDLKKGAGAATGFVGGAGMVKGGEVLAIIEERLERMSGDPTASKLYSTLLLRASQPYSQILLRWITTGYLSDPHDEFMVRESKSITRGSLEMDYTDEYWERRYTLKDSIVTGGRGGGVKDGGGAARMKGRKAARESGLGGGAVIPGFLEAWKGKILLAGKYLNVIRECGMESEAPGGKEGLGGLEGRKGESGLTAMNKDSFYRRIDAAYTYANQTLLKLLLEDQKLVLRLRSLKHYFFMDQADSFTHFMDLASNELQKKAKHVSLTKLQSLLDLALRNSSSSSSGDPYKEDLKVSMSQTTLVDWLTRIVNVSGALGGSSGGMEAGEGGIDMVTAGMGKSTRRDDERDAGDKKAKGDDKDAPLSAIDAITLDYTVKFPLSLVISRKTILRYQLLFRHLFSLRHIEQSLTSMWLEHTKAPIWRTRSAHPALENWKIKLFSLRARMLTFIQQMYGFAVNEVLDPNWRNLLGKLGKVETVDQLLKDHVDFLDTCLKECMLTNARLLKLRSRMLATCTLFSTYSHQFTKSVQSNVFALKELQDKILSGEEEGDPSEAWKKIGIEKQEEILGKFVFNFDHHSKIHLDAITYVASSENIALLGLVVRLSSSKLAIGGTTRSSA